ncbi:MAG: protein kinase domain-containing protein [Gammaproteobacteria bacterium]
MGFSVAHNIEQAPPRDTGTIAYMAPEHFDPDRRISQLTDIFALGSALYRLLSGQFPFSRASRRRYRAIIRTDLRMRRSTHPRRARRSGSRCCST